jgi:aspartate/methionine/tyrosine aminotransferase
MKVAQRALVPPFTVMEIIAAANARRAAGHRVLNLCMGQPSAGTPVAVRELAKALLETNPLGYTEAVGVPQLRAEIAGHYRRWYGLEIDPGRVAVTTGSSGAFLLAFLAAFEPGDRVVVARPGYPAYRNILSSLGCAVVELDCGPQAGYRPTIEQLEALDSPVAGMVLAGPANPTGTLVDAATMEAVADWCAGRGVRLVSDEIYHGITYPQETGVALSPAGAPTAAGRCATGTIVVSSFSKYWAMTGWRLGWLVLPDDLIAPVDALAGNLALCPPALAQYAAVAAFSASAYAEARANVAEYARSRRLVLDRMPDLGWARAAPAEGAFYLYADISPTGLDSVTWCSRLLTEADVAMTPGTDFDGVAGHDWVRLSFAAGPAVVAEALDRTAAWQRRIG